MKKSARFNKRQNYGAILFFIAFTPLLQAQSPVLPADSTFSNLLPELIIQDRKTELIGFAHWKVDSLPTAIATTLAERLLFEHAFDVRTTGPGVLTTISVRGGGPNRTPIFWNGLNLQSPMNGVMDASLVPFWPQDAIDVQFGGQSAVLSSGAMGGSVNLKQGITHYDNGFQARIQSALGSFGRKELGAETEWSNQRFSTKARVHQAWADNDFSFQKQGLDGRFYSVRQANNALKRFDFQQFNAWKIRPKQVIETAYWRQQAYRELPPATTESVKNTWQKDQSNRYLLKWNYTSTPQYKWSSQVAFLQDDLAFYLSGDTDTSKSRQIFWSTDLYAKKRHNTWKAGTTLLQQWAQADGYADSLQWYEQTRLSAFGLYNLQYQKLQWSLLLRQEWAEGQGAPFTGSFGAEWKIGVNSNLRMHFSRNFNLPTLNDRYWRNLGNVHLKPEKGYSADLGWQWQTKGLNAEIQAFHLLLDDWIIWQPDASGLFRPGNLRKVWSRGLESMVKWEGRLHSVLWTGSIRMQYAKTTLEAIYEGSEGVKGSQLPYTSRFSSSQHLRVSYKTASIAYLQQITGQRVDVSNNKLSAFSVGTFLFSNSIFKKRLVLEFRLENVWNVSYEILRYRPMPGRSWRLGVTGILK